MLRLWVTRPEPDASRTAERLSRAGHAPVVAPLLTAEFVDFAVPDRPAALLLTSRTAARAVAPHAASAELSGVPVLAVGDATAAAAAAAGFTDVRSAQGAAADLAALVLSEVAPAAGPLLYPAAEERTPVLETTLRQAGYDLRTVVAYRMVEPGALPEPAATELAGGRLDGVLLTSPRIARAFRRLTPTAAMPALRAFVLSEAVAAPLRDLPLRAVAVANDPDEDGLFALLPPAASAP